MIMRTDDYRGKLVSPAEALSHLESGTRIFVGSGCAEPQRLVRELARQADRLRDVEVVSLLTLGTAEYADPDYARSFRHNAYFIGANVRRAVRDGRADYTPVFLSEIPGLVRSGQQRVDAALVQLSPPDRHGYLSFGIHLDVQRAMIEHARLVIAEINPHMPRTRGESRVPLDALDFCVETDEPLLELALPADADGVSDRIGVHVAGLVDDGSCLQLGIGSIPDAVARHLVGKRHLGVHTEMLSDGILPLVEHGVIDNSRKRVLPGRSVVSFVMGTRKLYDWVDDNPDVEFYSSDFVNDPRVICQNDKVVAVNSALQVDLTGQVCADSLGYDFYSGIGGQVDFVRGAAMSAGGKPIIALPSTARNGEVSRIVPHLDEGAGVVTSRGDVHYVVTEHGVAYLHGKTVRERALALVGVAHPDFRDELLRFVKGHHYVHLPERAWRSAVSPYPSEWEFRERFGDSEFFLRPLKPTDARNLQEFFYSHTPETLYHRYLTIKKELNTDEAAHLCSLDYRERMAFGVFENPGVAERFVAIGRYDLDPESGLAETAIVVGEKWRRRGIGSRLIVLLMDYARSHGISGITNVILAQNEGALAIHRKLGHSMAWDREDGTYRVEHRFASESRATVPSAVSGNVR
jgi:acyl-CoA hydrolase/GNAT superfamily N-acetyltransferase